MKMPPGTQAQVDALPNMENPEGGMKMTNDRCGNCGGKPGENHADPQTCIINLRADLAQAQAHILDLERENELFRQHGGITGDLWQDLDKAMLDLHEKLIAMEVELDAAVKLAKLREGQITPAIEQTEKFRKLWAAAVADNAAMIQSLYELDKWGESEDICFLGEKSAREFNDLVEIRLAPHPGEALLAELARLRKLEAWLIRLETEGKPGGPHYQLALQARAAMEDDKG
jgi:hypothetical protein